MNTRFGRASGWLSPLFLAALAALFPGRAEAQNESFTAALSPDAADAVSVAWRHGPQDAPHLLFRYETGKAQLFRCAPTCEPVGLQTPQPLTAGQKEQLLSGLRSLPFSTLRSSDEAAHTDRELSLTLPDRKPWRLALSKGDWPVSDNGEGAATILDEFVRQFLERGGVRQRTTFPHTLAELSKLRISATLTANKQPGGNVVIEAGSIAVTPEEGSVARTPRKKPYLRPLSTQEQSELLRLLTDLDFDALEQAVPQRAQPAIGDDDGRVLTLHLQTASEPEKQRLLVAGRGASLPTRLSTTQPRQPRGLRRYVADVRRSKAAPLLSFLGNFLFLQLPPAPLPQNR